MVSTLEQMQVPNGTGAGVRRSKRPLLASRIRCNVLWKPSKFGNRSKSVIKSSSEISSQIGVMSDQKCPNTLKPKVCCNKPTKLQFQLNLIRKTLLTSKLKIFGKLSDITLEF